MKDSLIKFLSSFPCYENERKYFHDLENFLSSTYLIRPILVYSVHNKTTGFAINKCRAVLGKTDRLQLYSTKLLDDILSRPEDIRKIPCFEVKVEKCYYYYLNLGIKGNQFYFSIFSSPQSIEIDQLIALSTFSASNLALIARYEEMKRTQELIHIDDVTGLYNQRKLYKDLSSLVEKFNKEKEPFCVLFIDLDHFKRVNDSHGHLIGTRLLEMVAFDVKHLLRDTDFMYRYGGDEFVVILSGANAAAGKLVGERILNKIKSKAYEFELKDKQVSMNLSVSIGVAEFPTDAKNSEEVLALADRMMYEAKESGRGVVFNTHDIFKHALQKVVEKESS